MLFKRIPLYSALLTSILIGTTSFIISRNIYTSLGDHADSDPSILVCNDNRFRLNGYNYVKPLLFVESECESPEMMGIKTQLQDLVNRYKKEGTILEASIYLRKLDQGEWLEIGDGEKYLPGSLMKVPELITFIKMAQKEPGLLNRKVAYNHPYITGKTVHYESKSIELGKSYTIKELLNYMIVYSDNNATSLLNSIIDIEIFKKVFKDLGIPAPDITQKDIPITVNEYSRFFRAIYNASYLTIDESEFCAELLSKTQFKNGIRAGLPDNIPMAHKFGEAGNEQASFFGEAGIIYIGAKTYLITIMTKGENLSILPEVTKEISKKTYELMNY